ncbi:MAG: VCBS repeat-containing protein [Saprospiraceae bacterium]
MIYTNGDNADFPPINKPYHGIRIFENDGKNNFKEIFFYPLHGAYNAIPADFDKDGDLDIAAISFFPDFKNTPEEGFIYLENKGKWKMEASTFNGVEKGRWIVMDAGDLDEDGDLDLILGSLAFEVIPKMGLVDKWVKNGLPYILLENKLIQIK